MKQLVERLVQRRNPAFVLPEGVSSGLLLRFIVQHCKAIVRGGRVLGSGRKPKFMLRGSGVTFFHLPLITWGRFLKLGDGVFISALSTEGVHLGNNVSIGAFSRLVVSTSLNQPGKFIRIGDNVGMGEFAYLGGAGGLTISNDCIIGQYFSCHPENHLYENSHQLIRLQGVRRQGITIGANCWIGSKVTVLDGVVIGGGCVVAAGSVVTKSFPPNVMLGGVPAKILRNRTQPDDAVNGLQAVA